MSKYIRSNQLKDYSEEESYYNYNKKRTTKFIDNEIKKDSKKKSKNVVRNRRNYTDPCED